MKSKVLVEDGCKLDLGFCNILKNYCFNFCTVKPLFEITIYFNKLEVQRGYENDGLVLCNFNHMDSWTNNIIETTNIWLKRNIVKQLQQIIESKELENE